MIAISVEPLELEAGGRGRALVRLAGETGTWAGAPKGAAIRIAAR